MNLGQRTCCPQCQKIHTLGARLFVPRDRMRLCSEECEKKMTEKLDRKINAARQDAGLEDLLPQAIQRHRDRLTVTVYCNCCVSKFHWSPALDGSNCPMCGYQLSLYGPFEAPPSIMIPITLAS